MLVGPLNPLILWSELNGGTHELPAAMTSFIAGRQEDRETENGKMQVAKMRLDVCVCVCVVP